MGLIKKINFGMLFTLILWSVITLIRVLWHSPWYDEAHAWLIAQELNPFEIIRLMKVEGHTVLWYFSLMPFAKNNFLYPYSMLFLNWLFCFIAVLILWLKAPFNNLTKFLISFSFPFLAMYPVIARCYSIGIMFLFILAAMERERLKHPNLYAFILVLCANTSIMAAVGATVFGVRFLHKLMEERYKMPIPTVIMIFGAVFVLLQLCGSSPSSVNENSLPMGSWFLQNVFVNNLYVNAVILLLISAFLISFYVKNKKFPVFLAGTFFILFLINCIYNGSIWHWFFYYVYFVISSQILFYSEDLHWKKAYTIILCLVSFAYIFYKPLDNIYNLVWLDNTKSLAKYISHTDLSKNSNIIIAVYNYYALIPYFKGSDVKFSNYCSGKAANYDTVSFMHSKYCGMDSMRANTTLEASQLNRVYDESRNNFIFGIESPQYYVLENSGYKFLLKPIRITKNMVIHSVVKQ